MYGKTIRIPICLAQDPADYGLRGGAGKKGDGMKQRLNEPRPMRYGKVHGAQAVAVAALGEKVELGGDLCLLERLKVEERVLFVDRVVFGLEEKGWRGVGGRVDTVRQFVESRSVGEIAGVDDDGEIGAGGDFI